MGNMADTVIKRNNQAEKEIERRVMQYADERDKKLAEDEKNKKHARRQRDKDVLKALSKQLDEKNERKQKESATNKEYVDMVIARDEKDKADMRDN